MCSSVHTRVCTGNRNVLPSHAAVASVPINVRLLYGVNALYYNACKLHKRIGARYYAFSPLYFTSPYYTCFIATERVFVLPPNVIY